ncbi:LysR family transcriptional regulator [Leisingera daeponensis]|uniref:LysR family transcriptional regulator n=1 Tax=Leisingera daeponensis TaxID=405746 RepID=A0ABS7NKU4_9RHOB|nr:LysR substrate-binding domain-containing protein [Leisingera daeponensis]MBY6141810.1 LysR family transcriptional regulator [Leisingera daeponensis]
MSRKFTNLQTDLLRTFVTAVDLGNYTETGQALGRTQPAISLQIRRLEELSGCKLIVHQGKELTLTEDGHALIGFAREILRLNDSAVARLSRSSIQGVLRVGLPIDYAIGFFQSIISEFVAENPAVNLGIRCNWSRDLLSKLHADELDMTIAITDSMPAPYVSHYWSERPKWVCAKEFHFDPDEPLPLVLHPEGCVYRSRVIEALSGEGRKWRIAFESPGISALQNAVASGWGISALTTKTLLPGMRILTPDIGFPELARIHVGLFYKHVRQSEAALKLIDQIAGGVGGFRKTLKPTSG